MLWNTKPVCCHRLYLPAHSNCILFLHHHVHIIVIHYTVLYMCLLTHVSTVLIINLLPRELYSAGIWFKRPFSQLKEDQLLNWKTAYVSCNNEAAADTDTSHTQSITLDSLSMWHTHTPALTSPFFPVCLCMWADVLHAFSLSLLMCVHVCMSAQTNSFMREMENTMHLKAHVNMPRTDISSGLESYPAVHTQTHTDTHGQDKNAFCCMRAHT